MVTRQHQQLLNSTNAQIPTFFCQSRHFIEFQRFPSRRMWIASGLTQSLLPFYFRLSPNIVAFSLLSDLLKYWKTSNAINILEDENITTLFRTGMIFDFDAG
jgi:hypothetical protein